MLHDSTVRRQLTLTNAGKVPVNYSWAWLKQEAAGEGPCRLLPPPPRTRARACWCTAPAAGYAAHIRCSHGEGGMAPQPSPRDVCCRSTAPAPAPVLPAVPACADSKPLTARTSSASSKPPPTQLFDILPNRGSLAPGEVEQVSLTARTSAPAIVTQGCGLVACACCGARLGACGLLEATRGHKPPIMLWGRRHAVLWWGLLLPCRWRWCSSGTPGSKRALQPSVTWRTARTTR